MYTWTIPHYIYHKLNSLELAEGVLEYSEMATMVRYHCHQSDLIPKYIEL